MHRSNWDDDDFDDNCEEWRGHENDDFDDDTACEWDDDGYIPCPHCGETMLEDAEYCPSCDRWMSKEDSPRSNYPVWVKVIAAVLLLTFLAFALRGM